MFNRGSKRLNDRRTARGCAYDLGRHCAILDDDGYGAALRDGGVDLDRKLFEAIRDKHHLGKRFLIGDYEDMFTAAVRGYRDWFESSLSADVARTRLFQLEIKLASRVPPSINQRSDQG